MIPTTTANDEQLSDLLFTFNPLTWLYLVWLLRLTWRNFLLEGHLGATSSEGFRVRYEYDTIRMLF